MIATPMDAVLEVRQASFNLFAIALPGLTIDARGRVLPKPQIGFFQKRHAKMAHQVDKALSFVPCCSLPDSHEVCEHAFPVLSPERVSLGEFPLGRRPSLHPLRGRYPRVRGLLRYYAYV
jgi:hypothetical protein